MKVLHPSAASHLISPLYSVPAYLVFGCSLFRQCQNSGHANRQVESSDIKELGVFDLFPDFWLLQMVQLVLVGSRKIRTQRAVVSGDDDTAASSRCLVVVTVFGLDTGFLADLFELSTILVTANASNVDGRVGREDVLDHGELKYIRKQRERT